MSKTVTMYRQIGGVDGAEDSLMTFADPDAGAYTVAGSAASLSGFQALTNMTTAGGISVTLGTTEYVIPLLAVG